MSGLVGAGGGALIVPLLILGLYLKTAIATSLVIILFTSVVSAAGYVVIGFDRFPILVPLVTGVVLGGWLGVRLRDRTPDTRSRWDSRSSWSSWRRSSLSTS